MPKPKVVVNKPATERASMRGRVRGNAAASRRASAMRSQPVYEILEPVTTDFVDEYVPVSTPIRRYRPPVLYRRPIEERVTLPPPPQVVYVPIPVPRNQKRITGIKGGRGRGLQRNQMQRNNVRGVVSHPNFKNRGTGTVGRGSRGNQARGGTTARRARYPSLPKKSISQLDRELEDYMRKSKHPKIVI